MSEASDDDDGGSYEDEERGSDQDFVPEEEDVSQGEGTLPSDAEDLEEDKVVPQPFHTTESPRPPPSAAASLKPVELPRATFTSLPVANGPEKIAQSGSLAKLAANAPATVAGPSSKLTALRRLNEMRVDSILAINEELLHLVASDRAKESRVMLLSRISGNLTYLLEAENKARTGDAKPMSYTLDLQPPKDQGSKVEQLYAQLRQHSVEASNILKSQSATTLSNGDHTKRAPSPHVPGHISAEGFPAKRQRIESENNMATMPPVSRAEAAAPPQVPSRPQSRQLNRPSVAKSPMPNAVSSPLYGHPTNPGVAPSPRPMHNALGGVPARASPVMTAAQARPLSSLGNIQASQMPNYGGGSVSAGQMIGFRPPGMGHPDPRAMSRDGLGQQQMAPPSWPQQYHQQPSQIPMQQPQQQAPPQQQQQQQQHAPSNAGMGNRPSLTPEQMRMAQEVQRLRGEIEKIKGGIESPQFKNLPDTQQMQLRNRLTGLFSQQQSYLAALRDAGLISGGPRNPTPAQAQASNKTYPAPPASNMTRPDFAQTPPQQQAQANIGLGAPPAQAPQQMMFPVAQSAGPYGYTYAQHPAPANPGHYGVSSAPTPYASAGSPPYYAPSPAPSAGSPSASSMTGGYGTPRRQQSNGMFDPSRPGTNMYGNASQQPYPRQGSVPVSTPATMGMFGNDMYAAAPPPAPAPVTNESSNDAFDWTSLLAEGS